MTVDGVSNNTNAASTAARKTTVDYQSFLKLLVTQMKNQDPTKPMDSTDYVAQLATFSQVEQTVQTNSKLDQLLQFSMLGQADGIIGRTLTSADEKVSGVVKEILITDAGLTAILEDGTKLAVTSGVTIS